MWFWGSAFRGLAKEKAVGEPCSRLGAGVRREVLSMMSFLRVSLPGGVPLVDRSGIPPIQHQKGQRLFAENGWLPLGYFFPLLAADSLSLSNSLSIDCVSYN